MRSKMTSRDTVTPTRPHSAGSRAARAVRGWLAGAWRTGWWSVVLAVARTGGVGPRVGVRSGSGRLRGSDGPGRACLARLEFTCDCGCLECVCVGPSPLKDRLRVPRTNLEFRKAQKQVGRLPRSADQSVGSQRERESLSTRDDGNAAAHKDCEQGVPHGALVQPGARQEP